MTKEQYEERRKALNLRCEECQKKHGIPNPDHCDYHCQTGFEIHKLDAEAGKGWGSHQWWNNGR